jgi:hypothetical protein
LVVAISDVDKKGGITAVRHARDQFHLALFQQLNEIVLGD